MRASLLAMLIPLLLAGCDRPADPAPTLPPASNPAPATLPPGSSADPLAGSAPTGTPMAGDPAREPMAMAILEATAGNTAAGELTVIADAGTLHISGHLQGLKPDAEHGFHIHQNGDCSAPDASSAGDHFAPEGQQHGRADSDQHHAGDMPNVRADGSGHAAVDVRLERLELGSGGPLDVLDRAIVVHIDPDDYQTQPSGNSGARIACGVIRMVQDAPEPALPADAALPPAADPATTEPPSQ